MVEQEAVRRSISLAGKISKDSPSLIRSLWRESNVLIQGDEVARHRCRRHLIIGELAGCEILDIARHAIGLRAAGF